MAFNLPGFDLSEGSEIFADKIYNCYLSEEELQEQAGIYFQLICKQNSRKEDTCYLFNRLEQQRRHIETNIRMPREFDSRKDSCRYCQWFPV
jgi:hypothetical protein